MTIQTKAARKRRGRPALWNIVLLLALIAVVFLIYRQMSDYAKGRAQEAPEEGSAGEAAAAYIEIPMDGGMTSRGELTLVSNTHPLEASCGEDLVSIYDFKNDSYFVRDKDVLLDRAALDHLNDMMAGFKKATGKGDVNVVSGYRSVDAQQKLYNNSLADNGQEHTDAFVAQPGCSEHHTGLAVDLSIYHAEDGTSESFKGTGDYKWFSENAWEYGFILRYAPEKADITGISGEPWHFRYVGAVHAYYIQAHSLCLEEYIELVRKCKYDGEHLSITVDGRSYEVYYCGVSPAHVPKDGGYVLSGDNDGGCIVTVG